MQFTNSTIAMSLIALVIVGALSAQVQTSYHDTDTVNKSETGIINTEGTNSPEIIIDEEKIDDIPQPQDDPQKLEEIQDEIDAQPTTQNNNIPASKSLDITFYAQAPDGNRELPWKEACEEASIILAAYYIQDKKLTKSQFTSDVIALTKMEEEMFGSYIDTTIAQTAELYNKFYGVGKTKVIDDPSIAQIKAELAQGHAIVAPFAGRKLGNSYFTSGWPRYHMLVIRWYDETYFYTNDVGTKHGENFPYTHAVIMDAMHDLVPESQWDITTGKKRILVIMDS